LLDEVRLACRNAAAPMRRAGKEGFG
jgi:hypothetical protein